MMNDGVKIETKLWKDIQIGDKFKDGSVVKSIHDTYTAECYSVKYYRNNCFNNDNSGNSNSNIKNKFNKLLSSSKNRRRNKNNSNSNNNLNSMILSDTHLLLCDISKCSENTQIWIKENFSNYSIPTLFDKHIYFENLDNVLKPTMSYNELNDLFGMNSDDGHSEKAEYEQYEVIESDKCKVSENDYWLPVNLIFELVEFFKENIYCNGNRLEKVEYVGKKKVFCVETDSHKFETNDLIHHNSVTLRNVIFHCLTHGQQISIGLVDLKFTEFTFFKGINGVVAVANTVKETCELMRLARECMYKRNEEMSKIIPPINDIKDYKPQKPTDEVYIWNRKLRDTDMVEIRLKTGEIKQVTVAEVEQYLE